MSPIDHQNAGNPQAEIDFDKCFASVKDGLVVIEKPEGDILTTKISSSRAQSLEVTIRRILRCCVERGSTEVRVRGKATTRDSWRILTIRIIDNGPSFSQTELSTASSSNISARLSRELSIYLEELDVRQTDEGTEFHLSVMYERLA